MGRLDPRVQRLALAVLVVHALSLAGLGPSHAAAARSRSTDLVEGVPCNDLCKAYMAWSDRMMARFGPSRLQARAEPRTAAHPKRPERTAHRGAAARRSGLNPFVQLPRQSIEAPQSAEPRQVEMASSPPTAPIANRLLPPDGSVTEQQLEPGSAMSAFAEMPPMFTVDPVSATQEAITTGHIASGPTKRLQISLALALCALLAFGSWGWIRVRTLAASAIQ